MGLPVEGPAWRPGWSGISQLSELRPPGRPRTFNPQGADWVGKGSRFGRGGEGRSRGEGHGAAAESGIRVRVRCQGEEIVMKQK